jgi:hypothetical protein
MEELSLDLTMREALAFHVFLHEHEEELSEGVAGIAQKIRDYLYDRLSIEDMENPEDLLVRLGEDR